MKCRTRREYDRELGMFKDWEVFGRPAAEAGGIIWNFAARTPLPLF